MQVKRNRATVCALPSSHLPLTREASLVLGIVRKISLMVRMGSNPSGSRPNFFGRQHLTFDKGGKCDGAKQGIVRFWKGWWSDNPSGSRPNFFGRQHLTFDKGGKDMVRGEGLLFFCNGCEGWQYSVQWEERAR